MAPEAGHQKRKLEHRCFDFVKNGLKQNVHKLVKQIMIIVDNYCHIVPLARLEASRALKFSRLESLRTLGQFKVVLGLIGKCLKFGTLKMEVCLSG